VHIIVISIRCDRIVRDLDIVWHADCKWRDTDWILNRPLEGGRNVTIQPAMVLVRLVHLSITSSILVAESKTQSTVPHVVSPDALSPLCAGMTDVRHLPFRLEFEVDMLLEPYLHAAGLKIARRIKHLFPSEPVSRGKHLTAFKDHLDDMLVTVCLSGTDWVTIQYEDIHDSSRSLRIVDCTRRELYYPSVRCSSRHLHQALESSQRQSCE